MSSQACMLYFFPVKLKKERFLKNFTFFAIECRLAGYGTKGWINEGSIILWLFKGITVCHQSAVLIILKCLCYFYSDQLQSITIYPSIHLWMQLLLDALWRDLLAYTHCCGSVCWKTAFDVVLPSWMGWVFE